jgi:hypothetical protein
LDRGDGRQQVNIKVRDLCRGTQEKLTKKGESMKRKFAVLAVLLCAAFGLSLYPSVGYAQTSHHAPLTVKVPFEFVVGNQTFPAGTYNFQSLLNSVPSKATIDVLVVRSTEGRLYRAIVTDVVGSEEPSNARLVFTRSDGRAFLSEVWEPGKSAGCRLRDIKDKTQSAEQSNEGETVTLVASR